MSKTQDNTTPLMKQYAVFKAKYPDAILLYRVGDFYETFGQDALDVSKILDIVLTRRAGKGQEHLAGFPYHALDTYIPKLLKAGKRVAICDQVEDPKFAKGIVKRDITEIVTPAISSIGLDSKKGNYLCALTKKKDLYGIAFIDISTGEFLVSEGNKDNINKLLKDFSPSEIVIQRQWEREFNEIFSLNILTKTYDDWVFTLDFAQDTLKDLFHVENLKGFGIDGMNLAIIASGAAVHYIKDTNHNNLNHICNIARIDDNNYVWLDNFTIQNLELVNNFYDEKATLYHVINKTQTGMGARLLRRWLIFPLKDKSKIEYRQMIVSKFVSNDLMRDKIRETLRSIGDMERMISKIAFRRIQPNELYAFGKVLENIFILKQYLDEVLHGVDIVKNIDDFVPLKDFIFSSINDDAPNNISKGNAIKDGFNKDLDENRSILNHSREILNNICLKESEATGISNLKVGYNNVFGYYLEVTNSHKGKVPESWQRKQTLTTAERYITAELKQIESKLLSADENILSLENALYNEVVEKCLPYISALQRSANIIAQIDCLLSFANVSLEHGYVRPQILTNDIIHISKARHPVIESLLDADKEYVANDVYLDTTTQQIIILTGSNMSGKSAYLRQTALIVILAQIGCYVPAKRAEIGIVDKIFSRVGASDNIAMGESTFMVEMNETASILNNLSSHSLILLDEIGRGTSTYDGVSIAWAIAQYIHENKNRAKVLFATHYHELVDMEKHFQRIKNYHIEVKEFGSKIIFLRTIAKGGSSKSFGIHVAALASMPKEVLSTASKILASLQETHSDSLQLSTDESENRKKIENFQEKERQKREKSAFQTSFIQLNDPILEDIKSMLLNLDIDNLTPIQALNELNKIKEKVKNI